MTEFGPLDEIDDDSDREDISLPGVLKGNESVVLRTEFL